MMAQVKARDREAKGDKEIQEEMVGVLTAISIVSKRLATRLLQLDEKKGENNDE